MKTLLRNGIVRNDETQTQNIFFKMYIIKIFTVNDESDKILYDKQIELYVKQMFQLELFE